MKIQKSLAALALLASFSTGPARANENTALFSAATLASPAFSFLCHTMRYVDECVVADIFSAAYSATTLTILLKDVEAAQPDALEYAAGASASPLLESTILRLQNMALESGQTPKSFDEIVNAIIENI